MKKKIIVVSILILLIISTFVFKNKYNIKYQNNAYIAVLVNGVDSSSIPAKGNYEVNITCSNANGRWDYDNWKAIIKNINGTAKCSLSFTSKTPVAFNDYIIGLSGTTQGTGQVVNENGYRYEGKNPNNYVSFNGELWRIIGVFDSASHGVAGSNLVKLIKETSLGGLAWNKSNTNDWPNSSMYHLLNDYYYNGTNESTVTYCYGYSTTVPANCDFTSNGITNVAYRNMIQNVTWYLGGTATNSQNTEAFYTAERGTTVYSGRSTTTTGNIGLMYMSDYGYGVLASSCARTTNMSSYNSSTCAGQNWLYGQGYEWTIVPGSSNSDGVWLVDYNGYANGSYANDGFAWRPVLYLKSDVKKIGGDGTILNPYTISK
jgi:hypothetical protein